MKIKRKQKLLKESKHFSSNFSQRWESVFDSIWSLETKFISIYVYSTENLYLMLYLELNKNCCLTGCPPYPAGEALHKVARTRGHCIKHQQNSSAGWNLFKICRSLSPLCIHLREREIFPRVWLSEALISLFGCGLEDAFQRHPPPSCSPCCLH